MSDSLARGEQLDLKFRYHQHQTASGIHQAGEKIKNALREAAAQDLLNALGLTRLGPIAHPAQSLAAAVLSGFIRRAAEYDRSVARVGLSAASRLFAEDLGTTLTVAHEQPVPASGPLLIVSNHPGLSDTLALFSALPRSDLRILAESNPFLLALTNVRPHLLLLPKSGNSRGMLLRPMVRHLRNGGAVLTFPGGRIEPDPQLDLPGALASLDRWTSSLELLTRLVPDLTVLPVAVSGVLHPKAQQHPFTRIRRTREGREQVGAFLQLVLRKYQSVQVQVQTGPTLAAGPEIQNHIKDEMSRLLRESAGKPSK